MDNKKTVGKQIVCFERVAPGILINPDQDRSYWRDKMRKLSEKEQIMEFDYQKEVGQT